MSGWQDISTAPKDGTWVLLKGGDIDIWWDGDTTPPAVVGQWADGDMLAQKRWQFAWYDAGFYGEYRNPTFWMPLPSVSETVNPNVGDKYRDTATGDEYEMGQDMQWRKVVK